MSILVSDKLEAERLAVTFGHKLGQWEQADTEMGVIETAHCINPTCNVWTSIVAGISAGWAHQSPMRCPCNWNGTEQYCSPK